MLGYRITLTGLQGIVFINNTLLKPFHNYYVACVLWRFMLYIMLPSGVWHFCVFHAVKKEENIMVTETKGGEHTPETVKAWLEKANSASLWRPLFRLWLRQTEEEQITASTTKKNGVGYNGRDAYFAGSLIAQYKERRSFSEKQAAALRKMLKKYSRQLSEIANGEDGPKPSSEQLIKSCIVPPELLQGRRYG